MKFLVVLLLLTFFYNINNATAQCCSAGSGSPVGGGASQGVLQENQVEINTNLQYIHSEKFLEGDEPVKDFLDHFSSSYLYTRLAYGVTKDFTMSVETGYFFNKKQVELNGKDYYSSSGLSDLIIFPRYRIINTGSFQDQFEWTLGMGWKIPLGSYNDSLGRVEPFSGSEYFVTKPLAVQLSSGSNDFIFYTFFYKALSAKFRLFSSGLYIKKGWNPAGEKFGDYLGIAVNASHSLSRSFGVNLQAKSEIVGKMQVNPDVLMFAYPDYDPEATGSKKIFIVPGINYNYKEALSIYVTAEYPIYQYLTKIQIGSQYQFTVGLSYKFKAFEKKEQD